MRTFSRALALAFGSAAVLALVLSVSPAQDPKGKKDDKKAVAVKGAIEIYKDKKEKYRFRVVGPEDKSIAICTKGFETKADCEKELATLKEIINSAKAVEVKDDK